MFERTNIEIYQYLLICCNWRRKPKIIIPWDQKQIDEMIRKARYAASLQSKRKDFERGYWIKSRWFGRFACSLSQPNQSWWGFMFGEDFENMRAVTTMLLCCHKTILESVIKSTLLFDKVDIWLHMVNDGPIVKRYAHGNNLISKTSWLVWVICDMLINNESYSFLKN